VIEKLNNKILKKVELKVGNGQTSTTDLNEAGNKLIGKSFYGAFASDEFRGFENSRKRFAIMNTESSNSRSGGVHWISLVKLGNRKILVYDSFGRSISRIIKSPKDWNGGKQIITPSPDPEQKNSESNCGARCLSFILLFKKVGLNNVLKL
jgi:hypothetical protein